MDLTRSPIRWLGLVAISGMLFGGSALAGDIYVSTVVETNPNPTNFHLTKHGKIKIRPSLVPGDGGIVTQLVLANVECGPPGPGDDKGVAGKCGVKGTPVTNHVMALSANTFGANFDDVVGIPYKLELGKAAFQATGKNLIGGGVFGALVSAIFNQPLGIGYLKMHEAGTVPTDCSNVPLPPKTCKGGTNAGSGCANNAGCNSNVCTNNGCLDGGVYAVAGIVGGSDPGVSCTTAASCAKTQICTASVCVTETCTVDADCDQNGTGNGGTGQCGSNHQCCDPLLDPTCAGQL